MYFWGNDGNVVSLFCFYHHKMFIQPVKNTDIDHFACGVLKLKFHNNSKCYEKMANSFDWHGGCYIRKIKFSYRSPYHKKEDVMSFEPLKSVLVALDGSDRSFEVIKYIANTKLFKKNQTRICLFSVYEAVPNYLLDLSMDPQYHTSYNEVKQWELQQKRNLEAFLEKSKSELIRAGINEGDISVKLQKKEVGIARDIIKEALNGYGAIMIGRKGVGMMKYVLLGSIAMKLLSGIKDMPLALIGRDIPDTGKILVAMDNSGYAMKAVQFTAANFSGTKNSVHLVHVIRDDMDTPPAITEQFINEIVPSMNEAKSHLIENGFDEKSVYTKILTKQRSRAKAIMDEADNHTIGTIVTGRRGLNKVVEFFMGRVSNKIVQMARFNAVWVIT